MDRQTAYRIVSEILRARSELPPTELDSRVGTTESVEQVSNEAIRYTIEVSYRLSDSPSPVFVISADIHDNSSFKFELLAETVKVPCSD